MKGSVRVFWLKEKYKHTGRDFRHRDCIKNTLKKPHLEKAHLGEKQYTVVKETLNRNMFPMKISRQIFLKVLKLISLKVWSQNLFYHVMNIIASK